ncbi:MAG: hypothetical protein JO281_10290 [Pseudonocardiales bacterium]|nr:hypothetical protein [Pseudonocardiales bacterium]
MTDFTYYSTWSGTVHTAFIIDIFSRRINRWRTARTMTTNLPLDALDMAIWARDGRLENLVQYITPTVERSIPPFATPIDSSRPARTLWSAQLGAANATSTNRKTITQSRSVNPGAEPEWVVIGTSSGGGRVLPSRSTTGPTG